MFGLDESSSCSAGFLLEDEAKKPYVPRRLVIGNDEYVSVVLLRYLIKYPKLIAADINIF